MSDETQQPTPEPTQPQPSPEAPAGNAEPIPAPPVENPVSEPNPVKLDSLATGQGPVPASPQETMVDTSIPPSPSDSAEATPDEAEAPPSPESAILDKDQNEGNEEENRTNRTNTIDKSDKTDNETAYSAHGASESAPEPATAQIPVFEPLVVPNKQKELWKKFLAKVSFGKRKKLDKILNLFSEKQKITNDEVEKLLRVSDATATRYLETLEKEGKTKQIGKTGSGVFYEKI